MRPKIEAPPGDLDADDRTAWEMALRQMKEDGTWSLAVLPLLAEYVYALRAAHHARARGHDAAWDRASRRALALATDLGLTAASRHRLGLDKARRDPSPFDRFSSGVVDLDSRRPRAG
jgi:hypothetical protein